MEIGKYAISAVGIFTLGLFAQQGLNLIKLQSSYIETNGVCEKIVKSDTAIWTIKIINESNSIKEISAKREAEKNKIVDFLKKQGFEESEIQFNEAEIRDRFEYSTQIEKDTGRQQMERYILCDYISVKTTKVDLVKNSIAKTSELTEHGIMLSSDTKYLYTDMNNLRIQMLEDATADSQVRAESLAKVSSSKLLGLRNLSTGKFSINSSETSLNDQSESWGEERSVNKRIKIVVRGIFNIKAI